MVRIRFARTLLFAVPLTIVAVLAACDGSPTVPKFPEPDPEPQDSTPEEGMTGRWSMRSGGEGLSAAVMPFTFPESETT